MKLKEKLLSLLVRWLGFGLRPRLPQVTPGPGISRDISPDHNAVLQKVSLLALGKMAAEPGQSFNALPQLPLGVIPQQLLAQDGHTHASLAMAQDNAAFCHAFLNGAVQGTGFKGYAALAELSQLSEYRSPTETLATEMTRQWISFKSTGSENRSKQLQAIEAAFDQFKIRDKLKQAVEHDGFFGRGMLYIDMGMPELNDTPLIINKATIRQGSVQGFKVIEPVWTSPANYNAIDPTAKDFYQPHSWYVMGRQIHTSRLITLIARPLPDMLKPAYNFSGLSMTQLLEPAVNAWLRTRDSVSELVHSFSTSGVKTDMQAVLSGGNGDDILHRAQLFNQMRDNRGLMLLDKDNEEFFQFHTPLGGMESLQAQAQEQMAAPCHIPLVKLFGITPHGLNASSEGEIKVFYDYIQAMQQTLLTDPLVKILQIIQLHLFGEVYDDITFEYCPLEQMNEQQEVSISKAKVEIGTALLQAGVISKEEERQRLAADPLSGYDGLGDGLSGELPEQEQAGQAAMPDGMQAMDAAQCVWDPQKHPRDPNGQFCEVGAGAVIVGEKNDDAVKKKPQQAYNFLYGNNQQQALINDIKYGFLNESLIEKMLQNAEVNRLKKQNKIAKGKSLHEVSLGGAYGALLGMMENAKSHSTGESVAGAGGMGNSMEGALFPGRGRVTEQTAKVGNSFGYQPQTLSKNLKTIEIATKKTQALTPQEIIRNKANVSEIYGGSSSKTDSRGYITEKKSSKIPNQEGEYTCGAACAISTLRVYGIDVPEKELARLAKTIDKYGASPENLAVAISSKLPKSAGAYYNGGYLDPKIYDPVKMFDARTKDGAWIMQIDSGGGLHYIVVEKIDNNTVTILDPWRLKKPGRGEGLEATITKQKLLEHWKNGGYAFVFPVKTNK